VEPSPLPTPAVLAPSTLIAPVEKVAMPDDSVGLTVEAPGSPLGSESGVPEGMEEGVPGGVVGGIPGGVVGGVIGGTGTGPVPVRDVDRPPRLLQQVRPTYPSEAFVKKVEGTVVIEIVIDERGRVTRTRIVRSMPLLDDAAVAAVRQWVFAPALKQGRPVATLAMAPVTFRIF
jgi:protein TonB